MGQHDILSRSKRNSVPNNKIVCNHAKEISDTATGYFVGNPISYNGDNIDKITEWFDIADIDNIDMCIAKNMSVYGNAFELVHMSNDEVPTPKSYSLKPQNTFVVYDDTVENQPLFAVYYYPIYDTDDKISNYKVNVYTETLNILYEADKNLKEGVLLESTANPFGHVQIIEYSNNEEQQGDFEQVISLIDAYNILMSDRVNDKEQFVDAILIIINALLGDTPEEESETKKSLAELKLINLPEGADAKYLTRTFDENGVEILKKALEQDIHKFANVPCLSDENFAGNVSGVAMEYKLLGLEMIAKIKERYFKNGIKIRIKLYSTINGIKGGENMQSIEPVFTRGLPKNIAEVANIVTQLSGIVPDELLLSLLPFVKNPQKAMELLDLQKQKNFETQQNAFGIVSNTPITGEGNEK